MNKKTLALTDRQYKDIITAIKGGFYHAGVNYKPNERIATILTLEANFGLRVSDVLKLRYSDIIQDGERFRLDIVEQKTGKQRTFTVPAEIRKFINDYMLKKGIDKDALLFDVSERAVQKHLKVVCEYLGLYGISTHSFRKYFATQIYINNDFNIELVRQLLQHSSAAVTQKYICIHQKQLETALQSHIKLL